MILSRPSTTANLQGYCIQLTHDRMGVKQPFSLPNFSQIQLELLYQTEFSQQTGERMVAFFLFHDVSRDLAAQILAVDAAEDAVVVVFVQCATSCLYPP